MAETANIRAWCEERRIEFKEFYATIGLDCPYLLEDKRCSIYPVRPFLCRIAGVSTDLPCPLPLSGCSPQKVLNHAQSSCIYAQIYLQGKETRRTEKHIEGLGKALADLKLGGNER